MTFGDGTRTEAEGSERRELAPLTSAQRLTVDALALYVAANVRGPVDVETVAAPPELAARSRGAVLVLVTADAGGAPDYVTAVYAPDGARYAVHSEADYADTIAACGGAPRHAYAVRRESTDVYLIHTGGTFETERDALARVR
jgi:hypothetical protein